METLKNFCFACGMVQSNTNCHLIHKNGNLTRIGEMFVDLLRVQINLDTLEFYPENICVSCYLQLKIIDKFKSNAAKTLEKVEKFIEDTRNKTDPKNVKEIKPNAISNEEDSLSDEEYLVDYDFQGKNIKIIKTETCLEENEEEAVQGQLEDVANEALSLGDFKTSSTTPKAKDTLSIDSLDDFSSVSSTDDYMDVEVLDETLLSQDALKSMRKKTQVSTAIKSKTLPLLKQNSVPEFKCSKCGKRMRSMESLKAHMNCIHLGLAPYQCEICHMTFRQKAHLSYHMAKHENKRDFKCEICGKGFLANGDLKVHLRFHRGERPFKCKLCDKSYSLSQHLKMHEYSHKKDAESIVCKICKNTFSTPTTLRTHMQTIHNEPQFQCSLCDKKFRRKHHLTVHQKTHNNEVDSVAAKEEAVDDVASDSNNYYILANDDDQGDEIIETDSQIAIQNDNNDEGLDEVQQYVQQLQNNPGKEFLVQRQLFDGEDSDEEYILVTS